MKDNYKIMEKEIQSRIESDLWDMFISKQVIGAVTKKNEKSAKIWTFASLATAAVSLIISVTALQTAISNNKLCKLYTEAATLYSYADAGNILDNVITTDIELAINEIYPIM